jgi:hypothetical protein
MMGNIANLANENTGQPNSLQIIDTPARGFQGYSADRYEQLFDDFKEEDPQMHYDQFEDQTPPFNAAPMPAKPVPYEDTIVFIHFNKQGIRLSLQANLKTFIVIMFIVLVFFSRPGVGDLIASVVKNALGQH